MLDNPGQTVNADDLKTENKRLAAAIERLKRQNNNIQQEQWELQGEQDAIAGDFVHFVAELIDRRGPLPFSLWLQIERISERLGHAVAMLQASGNGRSAPAEGCVMGEAKRRRQMQSAIPNIGLIPYLLHHVQFGRVLLAVALEAAKADARISIDFRGCGSFGPYCAAAEGDARAIVIRDVITDWMHRMLTAPPETVPCLLCGEPRQPLERDVATIDALRQRDTQPRRKRVVGKNAIRADTLAEGRSQTEHADG